MLTPPYNNVYVKPGKAVHNMMEKEERFVKSYYISLHLQMLHAYVQDSKGMR